MLVLQVFGDKSDPEGNVDGSLMAINLIIVVELLSLYNIWFLIHQVDVEIFHRICKNFNMQ